MQMPAGWLVDRFNVKWVYAAGYFAWTLATAMTGLVTGFAALIAARLLLGLGESAAYPAISRLIVENFPEHKRGTVNSLIDAGTKIGPALSILAGGLLIDQFGWRFLFIALGVGGVVWLIPWIKYVPSRPQSSSSELREEAVTNRPTLVQVGMHRSVWGSSLGMFTANVWAMTQTMAGPAAGSWTGIQNCVGNLGGVVSPLVAGWSVEQTGSYQTAFYIAAAVMLAGIAAYLLIVGPIREIQWE